MAKVIESMTRIQVYPYTIRVWRTEDAIKDEYDNSDLVAAAMKVTNYRETPSVMTTTALLEAVVGIDRVSAAEVIHKDTGAGIVVYNDWP